MTVDVTSADCLGQRSHICDHGIATVPDTDVHHAAAIVDKTIVGQYLCHRRPTAGPSVGKEPVIGSTCRVFQRPRLRVQFVKPSECGVEVCLVEDFDAAEPVTFDGENVDHLPLGVKALWRGPFHRGGDDGSEFAQPMHSLYADPDVRSEVPHGTNRCSHINLIDRYARSMIYVHRIRRRRGEFVLIERGVGPCNHRPRMRVGGRFADEVAGIEFREGSAEVVGVEHDVCGYLVVGVDLGDAQHLETEIPVLQLAIREVDTSKREALPADRNDSRSSVRPSRKGSHV